MKTLTFLAFFLLMSLSSFSQVYPEAILLSKDEKSVINDYVNNRPLTKNDSSKITILTQDYKEISLEREGDNKFLFRNTGVRADLIIVVFRDPATKKIIDLSGSKVESVEVFGNNNNSLKLINTGLTGKYIPILFKEVEGFDYGYTFNSIKVNYNKIDEKTISSKTFYFRYLARTSPYGNVLKVMNVGMWFPVGQFGTNWKRTPQGINFNSIPLGAAVGTKVHINWEGPFYIGLSMAVDYTVTNSTNSPTNSLYFKSFSYGPILDINDVFHFGYNRFVNLTNDKTLIREPFWVAGIGLKFLNVLKNRNPNKVPTK